MCDTAPAESIIRLDLMCSQGDVTNLNSFEGCSESLATPAITVGLSICLCLHSSGRMRQVVERDLKSSFIREFSRLCQSQQIPPEHSHLIRNGCIEPECLTDCPGEGQCWCTQLLLQTRYKLYCPLIDAQGLVKPFCDCTENGYAEIARKLDLMLSERCVMPDRQKQVLGNVPGWRIAFAAVTSP